MRNTEDQLAALKEQIATLKKKLEEVEMAKAQVEKAKEEAEKNRDKAMDTILAWPRSWTPLGPRFLGYVGFTAPKCGMKPSTRLGLRLPLHLERQKISTTLKPSSLPPLAVIKQTSLYRWPTQRR